MIVERRPFGVLFLLKACQNLLSESSSLKLIKICQRTNQVILIRGARGPQEQIQPCIKSPVHDRFPVKRDIHPTVTNFHGWCIALFCHDALQAYLSRVTKVKVLNPLETFVDSEKGKLAFVAKTTKTVSLLQVHNAAFEVMRNSKKPCVPLTRLSWNIS